MPSTTTSSSPSRTRRALVSLLASLSLLAAACGGGDGESPPTEDIGAESGDDGTTSTTVAVADDVLPDEDLTLADDVKVVRSDDGRAVKEFDDDGRTIVLDADAEGADELEEGDVLLLTGVTVTRVASLAKDGDELRIEGAPVTLPEVVTDGELAWDDLAVDVDDVRLVGWGAAGASTGSGSTGSGGGSDESPEADGEITEDEVEGLFDGVNDALEGESAPPLVDLGKTQPISATRAQTAEDPYTVKGKIGANGGDQLDYEFSYAVEGGKPHIVMSVGFGSDLKGTVGLDVTFDKLVTSGKTSIAGGQVDDFQMELQEMSGEATLEASVQALENVASAVTKPFLELPFRFEVPILIGGIPFTFSGESTIQVNLSLAIAGSTMAGKANVTFGGPAGFQVKDKAITVFGQRIAEAANLLDTVKAAASGPVGLVYTTELPKFGLGFGYANVATAKVFVSNGMVVSFTVLPMPVPCTASNIAHVVAVGVDANFLGLSVELGRKAISDKRFNYQVPTDARCNAPR